MHDVVDLAVGGDAKQPASGVFFKWSGRFFEQVSNSAPQLLNVLELIGAGTRAA
jgi:hypothetical protein